MTKPFDTASSLLLTLVTALGISAAAVPGAHAEAPYNVAWSRQIGTTDYDYSFRMAVDGDGNAFITGYVGGDFVAPNQGFTDVFLTKYDSVGNVVWSRQLGTIEIDDSYAVAVDSSGNAYISGRTWGNLAGPGLGGSDTFLIKYSSSGDLVWSRQVGTSGADWTSGLTIDNSGNSYLAGRTTGSLDVPHKGGWDAFLTKYNSAGNHVWSRQIGTALDDGGFGVAHDVAGNVYISGFTYGSLVGPSLGATDAFLIKYDGTGNLLWSRQFGTPNYDESTGVAIDSAGNAYICGSTDGSFGGPNAGNYDAYLAKFDVAGNLLWSRQVGTAAFELAWGVAVDAAGNAYISGGTAGSLGGQNAGETDAFLAKFDAAGNHLWSRQIGTTSADSAEGGVAVDSAGNVFISGSTYGSLGGPNIGGSDAILVKFSPAELDGDFNHDGAVDAADYVVWRKNQDGIYTQNDFHIWRANFGRTLGDSGAADSASFQPRLATVPEPASCALLITAMTVLTFGFALRRGGGFEQHSATWCPT